MFKCSGFNAENIETGISIRFNWNIRETEAMWFTIHFPEEEETFDFPVGCGQRRIKRETSTGLMSERDVTIIFYLSASHMGLLSNSKFGKIFTRLGICEQEIMPFVESGLIEILKATNEKPEQADCAVRWVADLSPGAFLEIRKTH